MSRQELFGSITYFDLLVSLAALSMISTRLTVAVANRPAWTWDYKDLLGLGLILCTTLAFIVLRRRVSAQRMLWLRVCTAVLTVAAAVVIFRRSSGLWMVVGAMIFLFAVCLRSKTILEGLVREDVNNSLLVVGGILFALILAEGILRLIPDLLSEGARSQVAWQEGRGLSWHVGHPYIGHLHNVEHLRRNNAGTNAKIPAAWSTPARFDAWGFRNTEPWPKRVDIITVGDSLTYSLTVKDEQAWPVLVDRALAPHRVLNLGLIGAAPQQYLRVYETFGAKLSPKVLLVGLFLGNDLSDALNFDSWWRAKRPESFIENRNRLEAREWLRVFYLYKLLNDLRDSYRSGILLGGTTMRITDGSRVQLVPRFLSNQLRLSSSSQPAFALVLKTLEDLCTLSAQQQTHCLVLLFPSKEGTYLPFHNGWPADLAARFIPELDKRGIAYVDLTPHFRQRAAAGESLFWEVDNHPNARGYALIADVVLAHLLKHEATYALTERPG